jgi:hypothetical protein
MKKMSEKIKKLDKLGVHPNNIYEIILTTSDKSGQFNVAPMGVIRRYEDILEIKTYKTSKSYKNLKEYPQGCINITNKPELFFVTAFKMEKIKEFKEPKIDKQMRLLSSDAHIFVDVLKYNDLSRNLTSFKLRVNEVEIKKCEPNLFSRGRAEVIEALIHATRINFFAKRGDKKKLKRVLKLYESCKFIIRKVSAKNSIDYKIINSLDQFISKWINDKI